VQVIELERAACAGGWALAVGTGTGFTGRVVALFNHALGRPRWRVITVDNGLALPAAPAIYDLPLPLLVRLASRLRAGLEPEVTAAQLIAHLQDPEREHYWSQQNGVVAAGGRKWLIAVRPRGRDWYGNPHPVELMIYR